RARQRLEALKRGRHGAIFDLRQHPRGEPGLMRELGAADLLALAQLADLKADGGGNGERAVDARRARAGRKVGPTLSRRGSTRRAPASAPGLSQDRHGRILPRDPRARKRRWRTSAGEGQRIKDRLLPRLVLPWATVLAADHIALGRDPEGGDDGSSRGQVR